jgi:hypothetical protein
MTVTVLQKTKVIATITIQVFIQEQQKFATMESTKTVMVLTVQQSHHHLQEVSVLVLKFLIILKTILQVRQ